MEAGGRAAMTELRQVIGLLTVDARRRPIWPRSPAWTQLPVLADRVRETGVPVTLTVTGTFDDLPAGVELAAYRVVQEALTNAVKHAAGAAVTIDVSVRRTSCGSRSPTPAARRRRRAPAAAAA